MATIKHYGASTITSNFIDTHFNSTYEFDLDKGNNGLQIAFGLTYYDDNYEMINETEYGEMKARIRSWTSKSKGVSFK